MNLLSSRPDFAFASAKPSYTFQGPICLVSVVVVVLKFKGKALYLFFLY